VVTNTARTTELRFQGGGGAERCARERELARVRRGALSHLMACTPRRRLVNSPASLECGKASAGTGLPRNFASGSQPCVGVLESHQLRMGGLNWREGQSGGRSCERDVANGTLN
jgi:hypothetical protein